MHSRLALVLLCATTALAAINFGGLGKSVSSAKNTPPSGTGSSGSGYGKPTSGNGKPTYGNGHSGSGSGSGSGHNSSDDALEEAIDQLIDALNNLISSMRPEFVLAILFLLFTLIGGGYWLAKRYNPAMTGAGMARLRWSTWGAWGLSLLFYILTASWSGSFTHQPTYSGSISGFASDIVACIRVSVFCHAAWLFVLLAHTYIVWRTPETEIDHPSRPHFLFYAIIGLLALSVLFGGIVFPALGGSTIEDGTEDDIKNVLGINVAYTLFTLIAACLLLAIVLITQKRTRETEGNQSFNPLRWILLVAVPLWLLTEFVCFILADVYLANYLTGTDIAFDPSLLLFGIASLATIAVLPFAVVNVNKNKAMEA
ncbi:hypothetical protein DL96DRAFT_1712885 [Flagelloscypha sp. PMI_526]|nr:hypothetical protein DL96DRAFT_1712885 [Flagelloscypha sp. PMI_526]